MVKIVWEFFPHDSCSAVLWQPVWPFFAKFLYIVKVLWTDIGRVSSGWSAKLNYKSYSTHRKSEKYFDESKMKSTCIGSLSKGKKNTENSYFNLFFLFYIENKLCAVIQIIYRRKKDYYITVRYRVQWVQIQKLFPDISPLSEVENIICGHGSFYFTCQRLS